jgi:hypothetical protein
MTTAAKTAEARKPAKQEKKDNFLLNMLLNVAIPAIILVKLSGDEWLGATNSLLVAMAFPLGYGLYEFWQTKSFNLLSIVGLMGVVSTAGVSLLNLDVRWIAFKEAAQPFVVGSSILLSSRTDSPFLENMLGSFINMKKIHMALEGKGSTAVFQKRMAHSTYLTAGSFFLSAGLNYLLARLVVVSQPGTTAFSEEIGRMSALSVPVIGGPMALIIGIAILILVNSIKKETGLGLFHLIDNRILTSLHRMVTSRSIKAFAV